MRIAHVTDLHLDDGPRLVEQSAELDRIADRLRELEVDLLALTGDLYGHTVPHRSTPNERRVLFGWIARVARQNPETRIVVVYGNHDYPGDLEPLEHLGGEGQVRVFSRAASFGLDARQAGGGADDAEDRVAEILVLPFVTKAGMIDRAQESMGLSDIRQTTQAAVSALLGLWAARGKGGADYRIFLGHVQVSGSRLSGGELLVTNEPEVSAGDLAALDLDAGLIGHIHVAQEAAPRVWFGGSPWSSNFGEHDPKGWTLWTIDEDRAPDGADLLADYGRSRVYRYASQCPRLITLRYAWDGAAWTRQPNAAALRACVGHHVRALISFRADQRASVPEVSVPGALTFRIDSEVIPVERVRAPAVAEAADLPAKLTAYWETLAAPPAPDERAAALAALESLESECAP